MISFDEFIKQDDEEKYNNMQHDLLEIERLNNIIKQQDTRNSRQRIANRESQEEIERLNNIITEIKRCNSDYYNMINTLSSKLSRIREYVTDEEREFSRDSYYRFKDIIEFDEILEIINDNKIILGDDKE